MRTGKEKKWGRGMKKDMWREDRKNGGHDWWRVFEGTSRRKTIGGECSKKLLETKNWNWTCCAHVRHFHRTRGFPLEKKRGSDWTIFGNRGIGRKKRRKKGRRGASTAQHTNWQKNVKYVDIACCVYRHPWKKKSPERKNFISNAISMSDRRRPWDGWMHLQGHIIGIEIKKT